MTKEKKVVTGKDFVNAFYSLFQMMEGEFFVGSKEQARLILQLKLQRFICKPYIELAFKVFKGSGLIIDTGEKIKVAPKIGQKQCTLLPQKVYRKAALKPEVVNEKLEKLAIAFNNFYKESSELTTQEDIRTLRALEKQKGKRATIKGTLPTDLELLYNYPRDVVLELIEELKQYDPEEERRKIAEATKQYEQEMAKRKKINQEFNRLATAMLQRLSNFSGKIKVEIVSYITNSRITIGHVIPTEIELLENRIGLKSPDFNLEIVPCDIRVNLEEPSIILYDFDYLLDFYFRPVGELESFVETIYPLWKFQRTHLDPSKERSWSQGVCLPG